MKTIFYGGGAGVPSSVVKASRRVVKTVARSGPANIVSTLRTRRSGRETRKMLILSDGGVGTSEEQFSPLYRYRQRIAQDLGLILDFGSVDWISTISADHLSAYDAVGLKLDFRTLPTEANSLSRALFDAARSVGARCIVFDGDDDQCVLWPEMISACDAYIKKHRFKNLANYKKPYIGKSNLTDYAARSFSFDFSTDNIQATPPLSEDQIAKIILGWNIALDDKIFYLSKDLRPSKLRKNRHIDVSCRAGVGPEQWTYGMRNGAVEAIQALPEKFNVFAPKDRVSQQEYYDEMLNSKITLSPFGFGELCWRDFEAIACGCVLVKPDMSHVETYPDLFVPGETYLPVAWDYSNLEEVCVSILEDDVARSRLVQTARARLIEALSPGAFMERLEITMKKAGVIEGATAR